MFCSLHSVNDEKNESKTNAFFLYRKIIVHGTRIEMCGGIIKENTPNELNPNRRQPLNKDKTFEERKKITIRKQLINNGNEL